MSVRQSRVQHGVARGLRIVGMLSQEVEAARVSAGLSYADLGAAVGISGQQAARICHGQSKAVSIVRMSTMLAAVGLDLSGRAYPGGLPVRDAAHVALLGRLRARVSRELSWLAEAPVVDRPPPGGPSPSGLDRRAWDAVISGSAWRIGVEAETRLGDLQALERRISLKQRDGNVGSVVLLVNDTAHNRRIVADDVALLRERFPGSARVALRRLGAGQAPPANTLVVL